MPPASISEQERYRDASRLAARQQIYQFSTSELTWHRWVFDHLKLLPNARILELGCGNAELWRQNLDRIGRDWTITLSDLSPGMLDDARQNLGDRAADFEFGRIDAQQIPLANEVFDTVVANHMLYHVADRARACREIVRVLKPGGSLLAATNGQRHVMEIRGLMERYVPHAAGALSLRFNLEGGQHELRKSFPQVNLHRLQGELRVTSAEAIVSYIKSLLAPDVPHEQPLAAIRSEVQREIEAGGAFRVTTETGLFCAIRG